MKKCMSCLKILNPTHEIYLGSKAPSSISKAKLCRIVGCTSHPTWTERWRQLVLDLVCRVCLHRKNACCAYAGHWKRSVVTKTPWESSPWPAWRTYPAPLDLLFRIAHGRVSRARPPGDHPLRPRPQTASRLRRWGGREVVTATSATVIWYVSTSSRWATEHDQFSQ